MSPGLSFSGEPFLAPFWWQIITGVKVQTCRVPRKRPIKQFDDLYLYWKMRVPSDKKPIHYIGQATAMSAKHMKYAAFAYLDDFAKKDGFIARDELQDWFGDPNDVLDDGSFNFMKEYQVIEWGATLALSKEAFALLERCKIHPDYPSYSAYEKTFGVD